MLQPRLTSSSNNGQLKSWAARDVLYTSEPHISSPFIILPWRGQGRVASNKLRAVDLDFSRLLALKTSMKHGSTARKDSDIDRAVHVNLIPSIFPLLDTALWTELFCIGWTIVVWIL